ncbi:hypothetical protein NGM10_17750 (plasmid) [Halorussus salilacus]|uniref:hypothetical protein n=1 Tax=Halorussus salilacus TaxID=2953750 RepID=UPI0020A0605E|nr:hypothetical protein [Halorussus salilacus]USZ70042.1 hypothetical protein NGM10_17750 [Halorussus salilacus]
MIRNNPTISRRNVLRTAAGAALVSVAGCLTDDGDSGTPGDGTDSPDGQGPLQRVAVEGTTLVVELSPDADVDQINLIQPNGELFGTRDVAAGAQQVSFEIGTSYAPGDYSVIALRDEETVAETSLSLQPDLEIVEMGIGRNQPEKMWDGPRDEIAEEAFVTVENQGSGPDAITKLLFIGDVPYPSDEEGTNYADSDDISGIYDPQSDSEVNEVIVGAGEQITVYSSRSPFAFVPGAGTSCTEDEQSGEFELILETQVGDSRIEKGYAIQYSASSEPDGCDITISET